MKTMNRSRRALLAGAPLVAAAWAIPAVPYTDEKLTALYGQFRFHLARFKVLFHASPDETEEEDAAHEAYWTAIDEMVNTPATSFVGLAAKAATINDYEPGCIEAMNDLVASLTVDCIRLAGGAA